MFADHCGSSKTMQSNSLIDAREKKGLLPLDKKNELYTLNFVPLFAMMLPHSKHADITPF